MKREYGIHKNYENYLQSRIERCKANLVKYQDNGEKCIHITSQIVMDQRAIRKYKSKNHPSNPWLSNSFSGKLIE
jgi:hypothetical protein